MAYKISLITLFFLLGFSYADDIIINNHTFPSGFTLGVATAAYQIEGGWNEDGKGEQIWDWWLHNNPKKIENGDNGDIACDSYHKWKEDIDLLKTLGVHHYRLSIMWSRILPDGSANNFTINQAGIDYYRNILLALKQANITAMVTLYHWDLPLPLHQLGGWTNPVLADHFAGYARIVFQHLGDLVKYWITLNEPSTYCVLGYGTGTHAPGNDLPGEGVYKCAYTSALAHGKAYRIYEKEFKDTQGGLVSMGINIGWTTAKTDSAKDTQAVQRHRDFMIGLFAQPVYVGAWPPLVIDIVRQRSILQGYATSRLPEITTDDNVIMRRSLDFFALNTYASYLVEHTNNVDGDLKNISFFTDMGTKATLDPSWYSVVDWINLSPLNFAKLLKYVMYLYGNPDIIVTENGWADVKETLNDTDRITYVKEHLSVILDVHYTAGVSVKGYTVWSLMDSLEWAHGFTQKLGLVQVDFNSTERTRVPRDSFKWYQNVIANRCLLEDPSQCV